MDGYLRYAIYYAPPAGSALARFGAAWLGWDAEAEAEIPHPSMDGLDVRALTATPRKYGFHGTLKPPFRLAGGTGGTGPEALAGAVAEFAARQRGFDGPPLALRRIGRFVALVPSAACPELAALAGDCVRDLDRFRAPPDQSELDRRRRAGLSGRQEANLERWGYPYVMDDFRFHLTLTGALEEGVAYRVLDALRAPTRPLCNRPDAGSRALPLRRTPDRAFPPDPALPADRVAIPLAAPGSLRPPQDRSRRPRGRHRRAAVPRPARAVAGRRSSGR